MIIIKNITVLLDFDVIGFLDYFFIMKMHNMHIHRLLYIYIKRTIELLPENPISHKLSSKVQYVIMNRYCIALYVHLETFLYGIFK